MVVDGLRFMKVNTPIMDGKGEWTKMMIVVDEWFKKNWSMFDYGWLWLIMVDDGWLLLNHDGQLMVNNV